MGLYLAALFLPSLGLQAEFAVLDRSLRVLGDLGSVEGQVDGQGGKICGAVQLYCVVGVAVLHPSALDRQRRGRGGFRLGFAALDLNGGVILCVVGGPAFGGFKSVLYVLVCNFDHATRRQVGEAVGFERRDFGGAE